MAFNRNLDREVAKLLPATYSARDLEIAKGTVAGEYKVVTFKPSMVPEKKEVPEAFKKPATKAKAKTKAPAKKTRSKKGELRAKALEFYGANKPNSADANTIIQLAATKFDITKANARYYYDVYTGKR